MSDVQTEALIQSLEIGGDYRVLRRLKPPLWIRNAPPNSKRAVFLDVETTGLDPQADEIIELAMVPFFYSADGKILGIDEPFSQLRQPSFPIPPEISRLTGINDVSVAGKAIDQNEVLSFVTGRSLIVAHNAEFDRQFVEKLCPDLARNPWACSMEEVPWKDAGFESLKLLFLGLQSGFFFDGHRAENDCLAGIELLNRPLGQTGYTAFQCLLQSARQNTVRLWAENAPYDLKDVLKKRGYRWNAENQTLPKAWWIDVPEERRDNELEFLQQEIYKRSVTLNESKLTAHNRYSDRIELTKLSQN